MAQKFDAELVIDTRYGRPGKHYTLGVQLDHLFNVPTSYGQTGLKECDLNQTDVFPRDLSGRLRELDEGPLSAMELPFPEFDLKQSTPDRKYRSYVHEASGGGLSSFKVLRVLMLSNRMQSLVFEAIEALSLYSVAIHVRNMDLETDYATGFQRIKELYDPGARFLIASDDSNVRSEVERVFGASARFAGDWRPAKGYESVAEQALVELCLLATRRELHILEIARGHLDNSPRFSGFSRLAKAVWLALKIKTEGPLVSLSSRSGLNGIAGSRSPAMNFAFWVYFSFTQLMPVSWKTTGFLADLLRIKGQQSKGER